jgi:hypothetical protein
VFEDRASRAAASLGVGADVSVGAPASSGRGRGSKRRHAGGAECAPAAPAPRRVLRKNGAAGRTRAAFPVWSDARVGSAAIATVAAGAAQRVAVSQHMRRRDGRRHSNRLGRRASVRGA